MIQAYFSKIKDLIEKYAEVRFVLQTEYSFDIRPGGQGYLAGSIIFVDYSILYYKEYLDRSRGIVEKVMYSYHYQDKNNQLIFRYDNARHLPQKGPFPHKHTFMDVKESSAPDLEAVLLEIAVNQGWL